MCSLTTVLSVRKSWREARSISTNTQLLNNNSANAKVQSHLLKTTVLCKTPPLMLMQIGLLRKEGISHQIARLLVSSRECRTDAHQECIHECTRTHDNNTPALLFPPLSLSTKSPHYSLMQEEARSSVSSLHRWVPSGYSADCEPGCPCAIVADRARVSSSQTHR